jgi:hypothetical protein
VTPEWGRVAYLAYREAAGGVSLATGDPLPGWPSLPPEIRAAWDAAAVAVILEAAAGEE